MNEPRPFQEPNRPSWLARFAEEPVAAVDGLLRDLVPPDQLVGSRPSELIRDWLVAWGDEEDFAVRLDAALAAWVRETWLEVSDSQPAARRLAKAWLNAFELVARFDSFQASAAELLGRFPSRESYLGPFSSGPALDPAGRFLAAVAPYQPDAKLAHRWWTMCDVPPDVPYYHVAYVIAGIRGLPPLDKEDRGGFRQDVAHALSRAARGLSRSVEDGRVKETVAREEFSNVATITIAGFPFPSRWREALLGAAESAPKNVRPWILEVIPSDSQQRKDRGSGKAKRRHPILRFDPQWPRDASEISTALKRRAAPGRQQAEGLLEKQRVYALRTGDADPVACSLCNFAASIWDYDPAEAARWADEARTWEPWSAYTWNHLTRATLLQGKREASVDVGWQAIERFPDDEIAWNDLGAALVSSGRLLEAEEVFWQSVERFASRPYGWRGLGDVLRRQGELPRAESVYRQALAEHFPENTHLLDALGNALKAQGRYDEAMEQYRRAVELEPTSAFSWRSLAMGEKAAGRLDKAEQAFREGIKASPDKADLERGLEILLQSRPKLEEAHRPEAPSREAEATRGPPVLTAGEAESPTSEQVETHLSTARTLRRAARRRREDSVDGIEASAYAQKVLGALVAERPWEARLHAEAIISTVESGELTETEELLANGRRRFPGALQLAYAETRAGRALAQAANGDRADTIDVVEPIRRFRRFDMSVRPVELLETLRTQLANGHVGKDDPALPITQLKRIVDEPSPSPFETWWRRRVDSCVFGTNGSTSVEVGAVRQSIKHHSRELDALEEDLTNRVLLPIG